MNTFCIVEFLFLEYYLGEENPQGKMSCHTVSLLKAQKDYAMMFHRRNNWKISDRASLLRLVMNSTSGYHLL